jgi:hypothetical protein
VQAASQCDAKRVAALDGKLRLLAAEVDRLDGQAATAAQAQVRAQTYSQGATLGDATSSHYNT